MKNIKKAKYTKAFDENVSVIVTDNDNKEHFVPITNGNADYQDVLAWVADGNTIEEAD
tara:strand:+ start:1140 stop:1313 length:174 start_codon:yes stop_codon:yes gene_type:complete